MRLQLVTKDQAIILKSIGFNSAKSVQVTRALLAPGALSELAKYEEQTRETGTAEEMASKNAATLDVSMERLKASFGNALINNSAFAGGVSDLNKVLQFAYKHMDGLVYIATRAIEAFIVWKGVVLAASIVTGAYNIGIGIMGAVTGVANIAIGESALALGAYRIASLFAAPAIEGVAVANAGMAASFTAMLGPIALVAAALAGLYLIEQEGSKALSEWAENKFFKDAPPLLINTAKGVEAWDDKAKKYVPSTFEPNKPVSGAPFLTDKQIKDTEKTQTYNPKLLQQQMINSSITTTQKQNVAVTFGNLPHNATVTTDNDMVKINTTSTHANGLTH